VAGVFTPLQKRLAVGDRSGPVRVLGGAGTGKTVLAMHRAKWLAEHATAVCKKVLVTTFTRNLAIDIETNLTTLCSRDITSRIEVRNLDAWVLRFLLSKRYEQSIVYGRQDRQPRAGILLSPSGRCPGLDDEFYAAEFEQVVLARAPWRHFDAYRSARPWGTERSAEPRRSAMIIWPVFEITAPSWRAGA
jgi:superfamily I DNA/RNA helicase